MTKKSSNQKNPSKIKVQTRKGYKNTEIGVIPNDWDIVPIDKVVKVSTGSKNTQDKLTDGKYPFFVRSQTIERINSFSYDCEAVLTAGDGVGTGKIFHYINEKFELHQRVYVMNEFSEKLNGYFFYLYFSNNFYGRIMQMTAKSSVDSVRREMIADMQIPLPPLPEQAAIATVLSDTDNLIQSLEKQIAKKRLIKQGAMQKLLTPKEGWEVKKLGEICLKIQDGNYGEAYPKSDEFQNIGIPFLTSKAIGKDGVLKENSIDFISEKKHSELKKAHIELNDILFTNRGASVGAIGYVDKRISGGNIGPQLTLIRVDDSIIISSFLFQHLKSDDFRNQIIGKDSGSAMNFFGIGQTEKFIIPFPPTIEEQTHIATILSDMDNEIETLENKLTKYIAIKQGLMQNLLTGKIRLV